MAKIMYNVDDINNVLNLLNQVQIVGLSNANMIVEAVKILQNPEESSHETDSNNTTSIPDVEAEIVN